ncbi:hypothetical protein H1K22_002066 [Salmonella enterica]|nr:hypothetical protein [Salmonella enterica]
MFPYYSVTDDCGDFSEAGAVLAIPTPLKYQYSGSSRVRKQTRTLVNGGSGLWAVDEVRYLAGMELRRSWQETVSGSSATRCITMPWGAISARS